MLKRVEAQYIVQFEAISDMHKKKQEIFRLLKPYISEDDFTEIPITEPINLLPDIPRYIATSKNKHSTFIITAKSIQLKINFDESFNNNREKCNEYITNRIDRINELALKISRNGVIFNGFVNMFEDDILFDAQDYIKKTYFNSNIANVYDLSTKFTFVKEGMYYVNFDVRNIRRNSDKSILGIQLDVNSKYKYNQLQEIEDYYLEDIELKQTVNIALQFIEDKLDSFVKGAVEL